MNRSAKLGGALIALAGLGLVAVPNADAAQVEFYSDNISPIQLVDTGLFNSEQTITVTFTGVGSNSNPIEANLGDVVKFGTVSWSSEGNTGAGYDDAPFSLTTHQLVPSLGDDSFDGTIAAVFTFAGDGLWAEFDNTSINLGGVIYELGWILDLPIFGSTFVRFDEDDPFLFATINLLSSSGSADLYVRLGGQITPAAVPEPGNLIAGILGVSILGAGWYHRRRRAAA